MRRKPALWIMILVLGMSPVACFTGEGDLSTVSFMLSLEDLGIVGADEAVNNWFDWLDNGDPALAYDLEGPGQTFYMDLRLTGIATDGELGFLGESVSLANSVLTAQLQVSDCQDCTFSAVVFWVEDPATSQVSTFTGESEAFSVINQVPTKDTVNMDVWLKRTGSIRCTATTSSHRGQSVTLAALDEDAFVIFPSKTEIATDTGVEIILPDIPLSREMSVLYKPVGAGYSSTPVATDVKIGIEGQTVEVPFDIP